MNNTGFKPNLFLGLAEKLIDDGRYNESSRSRVVVGRAYYAAFLGARNRLRQLGQSFNKSTSEHRQVINGLTQRKYHLGDKLATLFDKRVDADYHMDTNIKKDSGIQCIRVAKQIIQELSNIK